MGIHDYTYVLQNSKVYAKDTLRFVPIIGWTWYFTETIFVARDWKKDSSTIPECIARYREYPSDLPFVVSLTDRLYFLLSVIRIQ